MEKYHFKISIYCPKEEIFDGVMTFREAHKFMDEHASFERRVGFQVYNEKMNRWENFKDSYHGGRKVYDKEGNLYVLDPDFKGKWKPEEQAWHLWFVRKDGKRMFVQSFKTEQQANKMKEFLTAGWNEGTYIVKRSDFEDAALARSPLGAAAANSAKIVGKS